jgi:hypothetical protein
MAWPSNAEVLQGIAKTSFYGALNALEGGLSYPALCQVIDQADLTVTYTSFGGVPEPRLMGYTQAGGGSRQVKSLGDQKLTCTVAEFETTVAVPRSVIETNPAEIPRITSQIAEKAQLFMERRFTATMLTGSTAGYDGVSLYNDAHPESGTNQDNNLSSAAATGTKPTPAELEADLDTEIGALKGFTDDAGTPVNAAVRAYDILCPSTFAATYNVTLMPPAGPAVNFDASSVTGRYRGMFRVFDSPFIAASRHYLFARDTSTKAVALLKNRDWDFFTNIGTASDAWQINQTALFTAYARFEFYPWDWKRTVLQVWT